MPVFRQAGAHTPNWNPATCMNQEQSLTKDTERRGHGDAPKTQPSTFLQYLDTLPAFHHVVRFLRLRQFAGWFLKCFPRVRSLPGSGARYRCRYLETLLLSDEIFHRNVYLKALDPAKIKTFADLGSNVGLFAVHRGNTRLGTVNRRQALIKTMIVYRHIGIIGDIIDGQPIANIFAALALTP